jgi:hypothetical protein
MGELGKECVLLVADLAVVQEVKRAKYGVNQIASHAKRVRTVE